MHHGRWIVLITLLQCWGATSSQAFDQHCRRWWGIGYGDGYHASRRCCPPPPIGMYYPGSDYVPLAPLPELPAPPSVMPEALDPAARDTDALRFSPSARLPWRSAAPHISR